MLPSEILNEIVTFLSHHHPIDPIITKKTLLNCGLVSKTWLRASRCHAFRSIYFDNASIEPFLSIATHPAGSGIAEVVEHVEWTGSPVVKTFLKRLNGKGGSGSDDWEETISLLESKHSLSSALLFPRVKYLHLGSFDFAGSDPQTASTILYPSFHQLSKMFPSLKHLSLSSSLFNSVRDILQLIVVFPMLEGLSVDDLGWNQYLDEATVDSQATSLSMTGDDILVPVLPSSLRYVSIGKCYKRDIIQCLLSSPSTLNIVHLDLGPVSPEDTPAIGSFLVAIGPKLEKLQLGFYGSIDPGGDAGKFLSLRIFSCGYTLNILLTEDFYKFCGLQYNTNLRYLGFHKSLCIPEKNYFLSEPAPWVLKIIGRAAGIDEPAAQTPLLETISFGVEVNYDASDNGWAIQMQSELEDSSNSNMNWQQSTSAPSIDIDRFDWSFLDSLLFSISSLKTVEFIISLYFTAKSEPPSPNSSMLSDSDDSPSVRRYLDVSRLFRDIVNEMVSAFIRSSLPGCTSKERGIRLHFCTT